MLEMELPNVLPVLCHLSDRLFTEVRQNSDVMDTKLYMFGDVIDKGTNIRVDGLPGVSEISSRLCVKLVRQRLKFQVNRKRSVK